MSSWKTGLANGAPEELSIGARSDQPNVVVMGEADIPNPSNYLIAPFAPDWNMAENLRLRFPPQVGPWAQRPTRVLHGVQKFTSRLQRLVVASSKTRSGP